MVRERIFPLPDVEAPTALTIAWIRWITFASLAWFVLSWDLGVYAGAPEVALDMYPIWVQGLVEHRYPLSLPALIDVVHFHWIHWFAPIPGAGVLRGVQLTAAVLCLSVAVFGRGPRNTFAVAAMIASAYVFGYLWRSGIDYTSMGLIVQIAVLYTCTRFAEPVPGRGRLTWDHHDPAYSRFVALIVVVFVIYYLFSGVNKLIDLPLVDWLGYDLYERVHYLADLQLTDFYRYSPASLAALFVHPIANIGVAFVYVSHLFTPLMILRPRTAVPAFALFYTAFHLVSPTLNIFFFGVVVAWLTLLPVHRVPRPVEIAAGARAARLIGALDLFNRVRMSDECLGACEWVRDATTGETFSGGAAIRRLVWALPLAWPLWPIVLAVSVAVDSGWLRLFHGPSGQRARWLRRLRAVAHGLRPTPHSRRATALVLLALAMAAAWSAIALWVAGEPAYEPVAEPVHAWWIAAGHALYALALAVPALRARWIGALFSVRVGAWLPLLAAGLIANHVIDLVAFRQLLWGTLTLSALILWGPLALRWARRSTRPVERTAAVYVVTIATVFAVPGLIAPPLSSGIEGWTSAAPAADAPRIGASGMALVRDDGATAWYGQRLTAPAYWAGRIPTMAIPRRARFLEAVGVIEDAEARASADRDAFYTWYGERYARAWPLLERGYLPHQRWLGRLALPTHNPGRSVPADYADFPPDRVRGVGRISVVYERSSGQRIDMRLLDGKQVDLSAIAPDP